MIKVTGRARFDGMLKGSWNSVFCIRVPQPSRYFNMIGIIWKDSDWRLRVTSLDFWGTLATTRSPGQLGSLEGPLSSLVSWSPWSSGRRSCRWTAKTDKIPISKGINDAEQCGDKEKREIGWLAAMKPSLDGKLFCEWKQTYLHHYMTFSNVVGVSWDIYVT